MEETIQKKSFKKKLVIFALLLTFAFLGAAAWKLGWLPASIRGNAYQAVFLTNGQVYFGKLSNQRGQYPVLTDIYYLRASEPLQPSQPNPNVNLVKLGDELHGPTDRMEINREQILFIENLKDDSQVAQAIKSYQTANPK